MKRLVIILSVIAVLGIISPGLSTFAQPTHTPHENPITAIGLLDDAALLFHYSIIINFAINRQYQDAQETLEDIRKIDVPDELRSIVNRYNDLCQQLFTILDNVETTLDEASDLIAHNRTQEAKKMLDNAESYIQDVIFLLEDIKAATETISNRLGVFSSSVTTEVREAYDRLKTSLEQLRYLINRLHASRQSLTERYIQITGLQSTELSLSITPPSVFVGDNITASGILSSNGKPLANRNIALALDNRLTASITTTTNGSYAANIAIPYKYTDNMTLISVYEPSGDDTGIYLASQSELTIHTRYYPTFLEVSAPQTIHPGLPFTTSGRVVSNYGNIDRIIEVILDDTRLAEETVSGQFSLEIATPEEISPGNHNLTTVVTPLGRYSDASETRIINIATLPIYVDVQTPNLILLPKSAQVHGTVHSQLGPVSDALVSLTFRNASSTVRTSPDGSFTATVEAPLDLSFISLPQITINIEPSEPWASSFMMRSQIFAINPLNIGLTLAILVALVVLVHRRRQTVAYERRGSPLIEGMETPAVIPSRVLQPKLTGIRGRILAAYLGGLKLIENICGVYMAPHITLREFLKMVTTILPKITGWFTELTTIAENTLYSNYRARKDTAATAEQLADTIKEELDRGTS